MPLAVVPHKFYTGKAHLKKTIMDMRVARVTALNQYLNRRYHAELGVNHVQARHPPDGRGHRKADEQSSRSAPASADGRPRTSEFVAEPEKTSQMKSDR
jgi:hypothetical protein